MNTTERKSVARAETIKALMNVLEENEAVQFGDANFAILQTIEGEEFWTEVSVKTKANKATKVSPAFDPFEAAEKWKVETEMKRVKKAEKAAKKEA